MRTLHWIGRRGVASLALIALAAALPVVLTTRAVAGGDNPAEIVNTRIEMTCFPPPPAPGEPPGQGPPPPCLLPTGLAPDFIAPDPAGTAHLIVNNDDTARFNIQLTGLNPEMVVTAWISYFYPGPPGSPVPDPIFAPIGPGLPPVAAVSAPLAPTTAAFTEGLGPEPNQFKTTPSGNAMLNVVLDYNPLKGGQGPLRNDMDFVDQALAPAGSPAGQPLCCPLGVPGPSLQAVGSSYLRHFDANGYQVLMSDGRPALVRSPAPVAFLAIVVHIDRTTHGINPGIPVLPMPGLPASSGDHFLLGLFDLRAFHME